MLDLLRLLGFGIPDEYCTAPERADLSSDSRQYLVVGDSRIVPAGP